MDLNIAFIVKEIWKSNNEGLNCQRGACTLFQTHKSSSIHVSSSREEKLHWKKLSSKFSLIAWLATKLPNWLNDNFLRQGRKMNWLYKMFIIGKFAANTCWGIILRRGINFQWNRFELLHSGLFPGNWLQEQLPQGYSIIVLYNFQPLFSDRFKLTRSS